MRRLIPVFALLLPAAVGSLPHGSAAQQADRKAIEAVLDEIPPEDRNLFISPMLGRVASDKFEGNAMILEEDRARLKQRYGATMERPEHLIRCEHPFRPETCEMPENSVFYQFVMPKPIGPDGVLTLRVVRIFSDGGSEGQMRREAWLFALAQREGLGWDVVAKELVESADGPWAPPVGPGG